MITKERIPMDEADKPQVNETGPNETGPRKSNKTKLILISIVVVLVVVAAAVYGFIYLNAQNNASKETSEQSNTVPVSTKPEELQKALKAANDSALEEEKAHDAARMAIDEQQVKLAN